MENLDYHFLKYIGVNREGQRGIHSFYLPFFQGCRRVADLGCGEGFFVELLAEAGIQAIGVDSDSACCREPLERGLDIVCQDIFEYLRGLKEGELDGIFSSHLVEHLTYEKVLELLSLSHRALAPGGAIVLTTPNARSLFSHLEMFYMHFGHVSFYHPNLLCFFFQQTGFSSPVAGENPGLKSLLLGNYRLEQLDLSSMAKDITSNLKWPHRLRARLARAFAWPYLEAITHRFNSNVQQVNGMLDVLDCSFECYVKATR